MCSSELVKRMEDGVNRLCCESESCNYVFWDNPTPVIAAIVEMDGHIIIARNVRWPEGMFGLITGFLERGETPEEGILREVKEELGLTATSVHFIGNYSFFEMNQIIITYHVKAMGEIKLGEELAEIKMVVPEDLKPWAFGTGPALKDWLSSRKDQNSKK